MLSNSKETSVAVINEIKELYKAGLGVPLDLLKDMTVNQFRNMMDELDKERNNDEDAQYDRYK